MSSAKRQSKLQKQVAQTQDLLNAFPTPSLQPLPLFCIQHQPLPWNVRGRSTACLTKRNERTKRKAGLSECP